MNFNELTNFPFVLQFLPSLDELELANNKINSIDIDFRMDGFFKRKNNTKFYQLKLLI